MEVRTNGIVIIMTMLTWWGLKDQGVKWETAVVGVKEVFKVLQDQKQ
jgi:hypothetical protein